MYIILYSMIEKYNLLYKMLEESVWKDQDAFPSDDVWAKEVENWLEFIKSKGQIDRFWSRLTKQDTKKRDEALAEIRSAYFLDKRLGFSIADWEPKSNKGKKCDFVLSVNSNNIFCEVKNPGWESDFVKEQGIGTQRLKMPKYVHCEARAVDNSGAIRNAINKAYEQLPQNEKNLLIIDDDLWMPILDESSISDSIELPLSISRTLYYEPSLSPFVDTKQKGCFTTDLYQQLSGILLLHIVNVNGVISYRNKIFDNPFAVNKLPKELLEKKGAEKKKGQSGFSKNTDER